MPDGRPTDDFAALPPGTCVWGWYPRPGLPDKVMPVVSFRTDDGYDPPADLRVEVRCRVLGGGAVAVAVVMFRLPGSPHTYSALVNHHSPHRDNPLRHWADAGRLFAVVHTSAGRHRRVCNQDFAALRPALARLDALPAWTEAAFQSVVQLLDPDPVALWGAD